MKSTISSLLLPFLMLLEKSYGFDHIALVSDNKVYASTGQDVIIRCDSSSFQRFTPLDRESVIYSLSDEINATMARTGRTFLGWTKQAVKASEALFNHEWPIIESTLFGANKSCLVIQDVIPSDEGVYTCFYSVHWFPELPLSLLETLWSVFVSDSNQGALLSEQVKHLTCAGTWPFDHICIMGHSLRLSVRKAVTMNRFRARRRDLPHCFFLTHRTKSSSETSYWVSLFFLVFIFVIIFMILYLAQLYGHNSGRISNYALYKEGRRLARMGGRMKSKRSSNADDDDLSDTRATKADNLSNKRIKMRLKDEFGRSDDSTYASDRSVDRRDTDKLKREVTEKVQKTTEDEDDDVMISELFSKKDENLTKESSAVDTVNQLAKIEGVYNRKSLRPKDIRTLADRRPVLARSDEFRSDMFTTETNKPKSSIFKEYLSSFLPFGSKSTRSKNEPNLEITFERLGGERPKQSGRRFSVSMSDGDEKKAQVIMEETRKDPNDTKKERESDQEGDKKLDLDSTHADTLSQLPSNARRRARSRRRRRRSRSRRGSESTGSESSSDFSQYVSARQITEKVGQSQTINENKSNSDVSRFKLLTRLKSRNNKQYDAVAEFDLPDAYDTVDVILEP